LTAEKPVPDWERFLARFKDVLVILLLINIWNNANQHVVPDPFGGRQVTGSDQDGLVDVTGSATLSGEEPDATGWPQALPP
jgi:hypothetical protein